MKNRNVLLTVAVFLGMISGLTAQNVPSYVPTNGLVGWWPFNGNANDESGNGNNGTVNGATLTADRFGSAGKAYYFDGNSKIVLNQHFLDGAFSLVVWLKVTDNQPGLYDQGSIFSNGIRHGNFGNGIHGFIGTLNNYVGMEKNPHLNGEGYYFQNLQLLPFNDNSFHCFVFSWNGNAGPNSASIHHNGVLIASSSCSSSIINSSKNLELGFGTDGGADYPFKGIMDDVIIYNRALSQQEITALYQGANTTAICPTFPASLAQGLVGYWPFCGNALDESGNNNHGTVNGATLTTDRFGNQGSAYSFDGIDDEIACLDTFLNLGSHSYTISVWAKSISTSNNNNQNDAQVLLNSQPHRGLGLVYYGPENPFSNAIDKKITILAGDGSTWNVISTDSLCSVQEFALGSWNLVTLIKKNSLYKLFINNILEDSFSVAENLQSVPSGIIFGNLASGFNREGFLGSLDDIAIWNRALTPQEIKQVYNQGICQTSITVTDTLLIHTGITSYNPVAYGNTIKVWPNPGNTAITLDAGNLSSMQGWKYKVANTLGQTVVNETAINQQQTNISLSNWGGNGIYYLHLINPQGHAIEIKKIVLAP